MLKMTEAVPGPSKGHGVKQEGDAFGFFDSLDILATIATQELKSKSEEKVRIEDFTIKFNLSLRVDVIRNQVLTVETTVTGLGAGGRHNPRRWRRWRPSTSSRSGACPAPRSLGSSRRAILTR